ncbi:MAG: type II secretion system protein GspG [Candidatus Thiodiazotropha sp.]
MIKIFALLACVLAFIYIVMSPTKEEYARIHAAKQDIRRLDDKIKEFRQTTGRFFGKEGWFSLLKNREVEENSFLNRILVRNGMPIDPWGNPYMYKYPGKTKEFDIISYGADGKAGGVGEDSDISN